MDLELADGMMIDLLVHSLRNIFWHWGSLKDNDPAAGKSSTEEHERPVL